jgi:hypothetical protein
MAFGQTHVSPSSGGPVELIEEPVGAPLKLSIAPIIKGSKITHMELVLTNNTGGPVVIDWDRCALILPPARAERVIHTGVRYLEKAGLQAPTIIPPFTEVQEAIWPANYIHWVGSDWREEPIEIATGDVIRIYLTWEVDGQKAGGAWAYRFSSATSLTSFFLIGGAVLPVYSEEEKLIVPVPWIKWGSLKMDSEGNISVSGFHLLLGIWNRYYEGPLTQGIKSYWGWGTVLILPYFELGVSWFDTRGPFLSIGLFYIIPYAEFLFRF